MSKENIYDKVVTVNESFNNLELGEILPETDKHRAILDTIKIGQIRDSFVLVNYSNIEIAPGQFNNNFDISEMTRESFKVMKTEKEKLLTENMDKTEYLNVFNKSCPWIEKGFFECGITVGDKIRFLEKNFKIEEEKKPASKRFSLKEIFGRKKTSF
jgi:hypothetical protein